MSLDYTRQPRYLNSVHTCVDFTIVLSGKLMLRGFIAGRIFFLGVSFITITDVAPISATMWVMGIISFLGWILSAHNLRVIDKFEVTTVVLLLSMVT